MTGAQQPNDDERGKVIKSYRREAAEPEKHIIEDALRKERDEAEGELLDIAANLGCARDEIIATIRRLQRKAGGA